MVILHNHQGKEISMLNTGMKPAAFTCNVLVFPVDGSRTSVLVSVLHSNTMVKN